MVIGLRLNGLDYQLYFTGHLGSGETSFEFVVRKCVCVVQLAMSSDASVADSSPVDVASFNASFDDVLSWLGAADDTVSGQNPVANNIETLKEQFHQHEVCLF